MNKITNNIFSQFLENFGQVENQPNKIVKLFINIKKTNLNESNVYKNFSSNDQEFLNNKLLELYNENKLSKYHFYKYLLHSPELLEGPEGKKRLEQLVIGIDQILKEFTKNPENEKKIEQAAKILQLLKNNYKVCQHAIISAHLKEAKKQISSSDGHPFIIENRFLWSKIEAWKPWLIKNYPQGKNSKIGFTLVTLQRIEKFINSPIELSNEIGDLDINALIQLYKEFDYLFFKEFSQFLAQLIIENFHRTLGLKKFNEFTNLFKISLKLPSLFLFKACLKYINREFKNCIEVTPYEYDGESKKLFINCLSNLDKNLEMFLNKLNKLIKGFCFDSYENDYLDEFAREKWYFPNVKIVIINKGSYHGPSFLEFGDKINRLGLQFPNSKCFVFREIFTCIDVTSSSYIRFFFSGFHDMPRNILWNKEYTKNIFHYQESNLTLKQTNSSDEETLWLFEFSELPRYFTSLDVSDSKQLTGNLFLTKIFSKVFPDLKQLKIRNCPKITASMVERIKKSLPNCKILHDYDKKRTLEEPAENPLPTKAMKEEIID